MAGRGIFVSLDPVKQTNNRRGLLQWLNLRGVGGLKTGKDLDDKLNGVVFSASLRDLTQSVCQFQPVADPGG